MVVGFIILIGLIVYLVISAVMIFLGVRYARKKGIPGWKGGVITAVVMYLLMFWDFIPFHVAHKYYCATEGGFTLNKTLEEWKAENPGVAETLTYKRSSDYTKSSNKRKYVLNQRFSWDIVTTKHFLGIRKNNNHIIDTGTGEILAQYVDFSSGQNSHDPNEFRDFKFWIYTRSCEKDGNKINRSQFYKFESQVEMLGSGEK
ncbi:MAG: hypothetical protein K1563_20300 [Candidatus Thiodiazotropha sp. (ex. Lucinisca nassula)]|nr:hypothetical protein [Candidatus Thiodiazotropha sp. (ex. Lucinisca nassula)]MBW9276024.1 hypothetical protein [Candidatus Thiodiazotropha sp. (ex. Lucinisca nassula)]PUB85244.1 MAG: hypothetical protein DBP02_06435 [gamma proteobacterium symbiont of Ctena orbiculata]PUB91291.1 MAG: hypothetical protein DBP01_03140 [gamma proteobacterium symbiont of Ctena orbiculata]